ncbi:MAG: helix-turn-helix domain-containing protein, partial [Desulfosalsimonas sp.]
WVEKGEIDVTRLVSEEAFTEIQQAFTHLETRYLKPVYEYFAGKYDYGSLNYVSAFLRQDEK